MGRSALLLVAVVFAAVVGANDGGAMLASGRLVPGLRLRGQLGLLLGAVALVPVFLGVAVARTFCRKLAVPGPHGYEASVAGLVVAMAVVVLLASRGKPTSLTLAVTGGLAGARLGLGVPVDRGAMVLILGVAAAAPFVGALLAYLIRDLVPAPARSATSGPLVFALLCIAYGLNDGQKVVAGFALAGLGYGPTVTVGAAGLFGLGLLAALVTTAGQAGPRIVPGTPPAVLCAEIAASAAVLASAALGVPVSMTQTLSGGLVGAELAHGGRKIRWNSVVGVLWAWVLTLPASIALSALTVAVLARL